MRIHHFEIVSTQWPSARSSRTEGVVEAPAGLTLAKAEREKLRALSWSASVIKSPTDRERTCGDRTPNAHKQSGSNNGVGPTSLTHPWIQVYGHSIRSAARTARLLARTNRLPAAKSTGVP